MTYKETLASAKQHGIDILTLSIAYELYCQLDNDELLPTDNDFEKACSVIERAYLKSVHCGINEITMALLEMLKDNKLEEIDVWKLIEKASYYV